MHVVVLSGGMSGERDVSLRSGKAVAGALKTLGYEVSILDAQTDVAEQLLKLKPDVVFNALHGRFGEDGTMQGILEWLRIPYTHSGVLASALAMDKPMAKNIFRQAGLRCPAGGVFDAEQVLAGDVIARPYVIKPLNEGSSLGVYIVGENDAFPCDAQGWPFGAQVLVEPYIPGREIQVAVLDDIALGAIEIVINDGFYDYEAKYTAGKSRHVMPAPIDQTAYDGMMRDAVTAHQALGCRGLTRSDFRYDEAAQTWYLLEVNTQPGMTELSLAPEIAAHAGISFTELVERLIREARHDNI